MKPDKTNELYEEAGRLISKRINTRDEFEKIRIQTKINNIKYVLERQNENN